MIQAVRTHGLKDSSGHYALLYSDGACLSDLLVAEGLATKRVPVKQENRSGINNFRKMKHIFMSASFVLNLTQNDYILFIFLFIFVQLLKKS